jgi:RNA polymerase sigma-70 factor (ECF subfamily)
MASEGEGERLIDPVGEERFIQLFLAHERRLFAYVLALVASWSDAEDLLQETAAVLWNKKDQYAPGTDFAAWATSVARYEVLKYRKKQSREKLVFSDQTMAILADEMELMDRDSDARRDALEECLTKLKTRDRELIRMRYQLGATTQRVAEQVGLSIQAIYKSLNRVHGQLLLCVRRALASEGIRS